MKLLIALVNYRTTDLLVRCLDSLQEQSLPTGCQIVVVDNHSQDGAIEKLPSRYPTVKIILNCCNLGYAKAVNQALRACDAEYTLLLNPDIEVRPGAIEELIRFMESHPQAGVVGAKLLNPDGSVQHSCRTFYDARTLLLRRTFLGRCFPHSPAIMRHLMADWDHNSEREVDWVLGACMLVRRQALQKVGMMDERFFLYFEDVEWCYRMHQGGWRVYYCPAATMVHNHRRQSAQPGFNRAAFHHLASLFQFYLKWGAIPNFFRRHRPFFALVLVVLLDLVALNVSFYGAHLTRKYLLVFLHKPHFPFVHYYHFLLFINAVVPLVFFSMGLYKRSRGELWVDVLFRTGKAVFVSSLLLMAGSFLVQGYEFSRSMIVVFAGLCILVTFGLRWGITLVNHGLRKRGFNLSRAIIVGTGAPAVIVNTELRKHREIGFEIVGCVRAFQEPDLSDCMGSLHVLGTVDHLPTLVRAHQINEVIIACANDSRELISRCKQQGVNVRLVTDLQNLSLHETEFEELAGVPTIRFKGNPLFGFNLVLKRLLDLSLSSVALALLSPLLVFIALLIKLESSGPVLFKQERIGQGRRRFQMYKFRSMCQGAEQMKMDLARLNQADGPLFKIHKDPRLTRIGPWLRRFSLDELPQLFNVINGEMSLVGPRPPVPEEVAQYSDWGYKRLDIKPGITGLWQVSGRSDLSFEEMLKLDLHYIWNWSLETDLKILLRTLPVVLAGKGAY